MFKLLAVDLDGTLLDDNGGLPGCNVEYINKARQEGVCVVICSGRSLNPLERYCKMTGLYGQGFFAVGYNGGIVFETQSRKIIRHIMLKRESMLEIVNEFKKFHVEIMMYAFDRIKSVTDTINTRNYLRISMTPVDLLKDFADIETDVSKILAIGEKKELLRLERHMLDKFGRSYNMFLTGPYLFEVSSLGADKGAGLMFLADYLGIKPDQVIACGDYYNDIQMLKAAGLGVAVANAEPEVKKAADYITQADNNEGAISEVIRKFILV